MVNKCVIVGCRFGYLDFESISSFRFPFGKLALLEKWAQFVNRANWKPFTNSVVCAKHFEKKILSSGNKIEMECKSYTHFAHLICFTTIVKFKNSHSTTQTSTAANIPIRSIRRFCQKRQNRKFQ